MGAAPEIRICGSCPCEPFPAKQTGEKTGAVFRDIVEPLYWEDNGCPSIDPVVLFKMVRIQHPYGLPSLRQTAEALMTETIERVYADVKEKHGMRYPRYTGMARVTNWVRLKFAAIGLKKLAIRK